MEEGADKLNLDALGWHSRLVDLHIVPDKLAARAKLAVCPIEHIGRFYRRAACRLFSGEEKGSQFLEELFCWHPSGTMGSTARVGWIIVGWITGYSCAAGGLRAIARDTFPFVLGDREALKSRSGLLLPLL